MLPVVVYNIDPQDYDVLLEQLQEGAEDAQVEFKIELNTMEPKAAQSAVKNEKNIMLLITGIDSLAEDKERYGLKLGRLAMSQNRDNYAVFITRNRRNVEDVLCLCMRPAGVMAVPLDRRRIAAVFRQILTDFYRLDNQHIPNGKYIVCKVGSTPMKSCSCRRWTRRSTSAPPSRASRCTRPWPRWRICWASSSSSATAPT